MANLCSNYVEIYGDASDLDKIKDEYLKSDAIGYEYQEFRYGNDTNHLILSFGTKWSPPLGWLLYLSSQYDVIVNCESEEGGADFWGKYSFRGGKNIYKFELPYLQGKYFISSWSDFIEEVVMGMLDDPEPFDEFMAKFKFCSEYERNELEELFFEHSNEN